ncbi:hypothetical protein E2C01_053109 [Portunus trituberculatus]|uniref:Uncharacterized protein n=1 Tax=Portunus trituberculatus TaxID=210409 RepID=A0A5B7GR46_PORTR|nr:hypothetical protein [Portunus trituberculatus]
MGRGGNQEWLEGRGGLGADWSGEPRGAMNTRVVHRNSGELLHGERPRPGYGITLISGQRLAGNHRLTQHIDSKVTRSLLQGWEEEEEEGERGDEGGGRKKNVMVAAEARGERKGRREKENVSWFLVHVYVLRSSLASLRLTSPHLTSLHRLPAFLPACLPSLRLVGCVHISQSPKHPHSTFQPSSILRLPP